MALSIHSRGARALAGLLLMACGVAQQAHADCPLFTGNDVQYYPDEVPYTVGVTVGATPGHVQPGGRVRLDVDMTSTFPDCGSRDVTLILKMPPGGGVTVYGAEGSVPTGWTCAVDPATPSRNYDRFTCSSGISPSGQLNYTHPQHVTVVVNAPSTPNVTHTIKAHVRSGYGYDYSDEPYNYDPYWGNNGPNAVHPAPMAYADSTAQFTVDPVNAYAYTYVPQNTNASLQTAPVEAVTTASPVFGLAELPGRPVGYLARLFVTTNGPDLNTSCLLGFLYAANGQAYLCRDTQVLAGLLGPVLGGNGQGKRWVVIDTVDLADGNQVDFPVGSPMQLTLRQHSTLVSGLQGLNLFPYGVFYTTADFASPRVAGTLCSSNGNVPPCLSAAGTKQSDGSYRSTFRISNAPMVARTPVDHLLALMDFVVGPVGAGSIKPPILYK